MRRLDYVTLQIEAAIAAAHRRTLQAAHMAETRSDQGLADDLHQISVELQRIQEDLLKSRRPRRTPIRNRA